VNDTRTIWQGNEHLYKSFGVISQQPYRYCNAQGGCRGLLGCAAVDGGGEALTTCGSDKCVNAQRCNKGQPTTTSDSIAKVCKINVDEASCDNVMCTGKYAGWTGASCMLWDSDSTGFCNVGGGELRLPRTQTNRKIIYERLHINL
jgi:hypothetical protein